METPSPPPSLRLRLLQTGIGLIQGVQHGLMGAQIYLHRKLALEHRFEIRPGDVFISTYPKSGTTLLQMIVHQLRGDGGMDIPHINAVVPWLESEVTAENYGFLAALPSPRVFKTHLHYELLPPGAKYIYAVRDVREVFVSGLHHQSLMLGRRLSPEAFARQFGRGQAGTWFKHLESWWPHRHDPNVLFLTFEGMVADLEGTVRRVAAFCGLPLDEAEMPRILERCSLGFMKRHEAKFDPRLSHTDADLAAFIRKGKAGVWQEELPAAEREMLEAKVRDLAGKLAAGGAGGAGGDAGDDPFGYLVRGEAPPGPGTPAL